MIPAAKLSKCKGVVNYIQCLQQVLEQPPCVALTVGNKDRGLVATAAATDGTQLFAEQPLHVVVSEGNDRVSGAMDFALAAFNADNLHTLAIVSDMYAWEDMEPMFDDFVVDGVKERYSKEQAAVVTTAALNSCSPNCVYEYIEAEAVVRVTATKDVDIGDELCISYLKLAEHEQSVSERRALLQDRFNFRCECDRCIAEDEKLVEGVAAPSVAVPAAGGGRIQQQDGKRKRKRKWKQNEATKTTATKK
eukprot:gene4447-12756_t